MRAVALVRVVLAALLVLPAVALRARAEDAPAPDKPNRDLTRGYVCLSWQLGQRLTDDERKELGIQVEKGMVIAYVTPGGPADKAGVLPGDVPVSFAGFVFPDTKEMATDDETFRKFMEEKVKPVADKIDPGATVELVVERAGKKLTFAMVAVAKARADELAEEAQREKSAVKVPKPEGRGEPKEAKLDFEAPLAEGEFRPADLLQVTGYFEVGEEEGKPGNHVLTQLGDEQDLCVALVVADGRVYGDSTASVRFVLKGGDRSVSAGIVLRARDRKNFYALRIDGVAQNLAIVKVADGVATTLATTTAKSPKLAVWHTLEVAAAGKTLTATMDGATKVTVDDATFTSGWSGLMTAMDGQAVFDDLVLRPAPAK